MEYSAVPIWHAKLSLTTDTAQLTPGSSTRVCHYPNQWWIIVSPDSKVHGANMGPIWGRQDPDGPLFGPMNLAICDIASEGISMPWCDHTLPTATSVFSPQCPFVRRIHRWSVGFALMSTSLNRRMTHTFATKMNTLKPTVWMHEWLHEDPDKAWRPEWLDRVKDLFKVVTHRDLQKCPGKGAEVQVGNLWWNHNNKINQTFRIRCCFCLWLSNISANERGRCIRNLFSHLLSHGDTGSS